MKKILLISNYYSAYISAGTSQRTRDIKKGLSNLGWSCKLVTIIRKNYPISREPDKEDIIGIPSLSERYPIPFRKLIKLYKLIKTTNVVHIIDHWSILNILIVYFCRVSKTPYVFSPCGALKPIGRNICLKEIYNFIFLKFILRHASYIFAITKNEFTEINMIQNNKDKIIILPNGIWGKSIINKEDKEKVKDKYKIKKSKFKDFKIPSNYILFVGRLSHIKGPDILADAFLKMKIRKNYFLIFAGPDDNMQSKITKLVKNSILKKKIIFLGKIYQEERDFLMKNASLVVIPSRREAMSLVALESSILETPFLATKNCGLEDFEKNKAGFICSGNSDSLAVELDLILKDRENLNRVGQNAKKLTLEKYTWEIILKKMSFYLFNSIKNEF
jgi:glycosyltransferase involved in cell wall biosynthesis